MTENQFETGQASDGYPPKPEVLDQGRNAVIRSLLSLFIYGLLFYAIFGYNFAYIAGIILVIIVHELGHFFAMKAFGYSNPRIFIVPLLSSFTAGKKQEVSQWQLSLVILAGPVPGILIGLVLYFLNMSVPNETVKMLAISFLYINLLNCLPFFPLDGGRLLETLFIQQSYLLRIIFGGLSIAVLFLLFLFYNSPVMLVVPVLITLELYNESKHEKIREYLRKEGIHYRAAYEHLANRDYWLIRDCLLFSFPKKYAGIEPGVYNYSFAESLLVQHIRSVLQPNIHSELSAVKKLLVLLLYMAAFIGPLLFLLRQSI